MTLAGTSSEAGTISKMAKQAEAEAEVLSEALEVNLTELATNEVLKRDLGDVELRLKHEIDLVRLEMRDIERRMTIKLGALMVLAIGVVATLVKLLYKRSPRAPSLIRKMSRAFVLAHTASRCLFINLLRHSGQNLRHATFSQVIDLRILSGLYRGICQICQCSFATADC